MPNIFIKHKEVNSMNSKQSFKADIAEFRKRGGKFNFSFGDINIPVCYDEQQDIVYTHDSEYKMSMKVDYTLDMEDNLDALLNKLLEKYPCLTC